MDLHGSVEQASWRFWEDAHEDIEENWKHSANQPHVLDAGVGRPDAIVNGTASASCRRIKSYPGPIIRFGPITPGIKLVPRLQILISGGQYPRQC